MSLQPDTLTTDSLNICIIVMVCVLHPQRTHYCFYHHFVYLNFKLCLFIYLHYQRLTHIIKNDRESHYYEVCIRYTTVLRKLHYQSLFPLYCVMQMECIFPHQKKFRSFIKEESGPYHALSLFSVP